MKRSGGERAASNSTFCRLLIGILLFASLAGSAVAADGIVVTNVSGRAYAMVIDSLGRIVTGGGRYWGNGFALTRYNSDGSLDTTFGDSGLVTTDIKGYGLSLGPNAIAMDNLGRIVVAGTSSPLAKSSGSFVFLNSDFFLARYNSDGSLDISFGNGGIVTTDVSRGERYDWANAVAIDGVGRIVVAGYTSTIHSPSMSYPSMALARYDSDGFLDGTFGDGGIVITDIYSRSLVIGMAIDNLGRIVTAGSSNSAFTLARYNSDGTLDHTFGGDNGIVTITNIGGIGGYEWAATVAIDSLGRIVAAGQAPTFVDAREVHSSFALVRCNSDGTLDTSFGNGGTVTTHISGYGVAREDSVAGMVIDSLGRIVAVGSCPFDCGAFDFELARYNSDGTLDATFGNGGLVTTHLGTTFSDNSSQAVSIDRVGLIVVAGSSDDDSALVRYNSDGTLDNTFGVDP
jgi:uncharacterized delta-60 repeat protein